MSKSVWIVTVGVEYYHDNRQCIIEHRQENKNDPQPRKVSIEEAKSRNLSPCSHCCGNGYERTKKGGRVSILERILQEQDKQIADD